MSKKGCPMAALSYDQCALNLTITEKRVQAISGALGLQR
jgi:hypothetical protein